MENHVILTAYHKKSKSTKLYPIYLRVTLNTSNSLISVGHSINPIKWDSIHQIVKGKTGEP
jgi:hypothetical protein